MGSISQVINELPGVQVTEADFYGSADWATSIQLRGFNSGPAGQQIGSTVDGIPNGSSNYGGGSKPNRFIDIINLRNVEVTQGTADISSRTLESLGGTLHYKTQDPEKTSRIRVLAGMGDQSGSKYAVRYDTGEFLPNTYAYISASLGRNKDFVDNVTPITRDYINAKIVSNVNGYELTGWLSYNDAFEAEVEPVSLATFKSNPRRDALNGAWTGEPRYDEYYRDAWRALRENTLVWVGAKKAFGDLTLEAKAYGHQQIGRGDWVPPYMLDAVNDGAGNPHSELKNAQVFGGSTPSRFYYINPNGTTATKIAGCTTDNDPGCYSPSALPVMSYRHTHYKLDRYGIMGDFTLKGELAGFENVLRGGFWFESQDAVTVRDWHNVLNAKVGPAFNHTPYWVQYRREFDAKISMLYIEDAIKLGALTAKLGLKQYGVDRDFERTIGGTQISSLNTTSDPLVQFGLNYQTTIDGLEVFFGYAENYNAVPQDRIATAQSELKNIEAETADSAELGLRYNTKKLRLSATAFDINFQNKTTFVASSVVSGIDYLSQNQGTYINLGGVKSKGLELWASYKLTDKLSVNGSYTYNDATYVSTGFTNLDTASGIKPGAQLYAAPKNMLNLGLEYQGPVWSSGIASKYVGKRFVDFANTQEADSYVLTNAYVGINGSSVSDVLKGYELRMTVNNLTNAEYVNGITGGSVYPAPPRTVFFSVQADF